jgi:hypothetical protein
MGDEAGIRKIGKVLVESQGRRICPTQECLFLDSIQASLQIRGPSSP